MISNKNQKRKLSATASSSFLSTLEAGPAAKSAKPTMSAAKFGGFPGWQNGLKSAMRDASQTLFSDDVCVIIADKYPKARHHYLVMPKHQIDSLTHVKRSDAPMLRRMLTAAESFIVGKNLSLVDFRFGFHAVPSMSQLHMHVISQDFVSPCLKTKKHWLSFTTDFFLDCSLLLQLLESETDHESSFKGRQSQESLVASGRLGVRGSVLSACLATDRAWFSGLAKAGELKCNQCARVAKNMPELKQHLETHENKKNLS